MLIAEKVNYSDSEDEASRCRRGDLETKPRSRGYNLFGSGDWFHGRKFFCGPECRRWGGGKLFKCIALLCTLFLLSLHHLPLRVPGIRSWRLGTPVLGTSGALQLHTFTFFFFFFTPFTVSTQTYFHVMEHQSFRSCVYCCCSVTKS